MADVPRSFYDMARRVAQTLEAEGRITGKIPRKEFAAALMQALGERPAGKLETLVNALDVSGGSIAEVMTSSEKFNMQAAMDAADDVLGAATETTTAGRGGLAELLAASGEQRKKGLGIWKRVKQARQVGLDPAMRVAREAVSPERVTDPLAEVLRLERGRVSGAAGKAARTAGRALPEAGAAASGVEQKLLDELLVQARARFGKPRTAGKPGVLAEAMKREAGKGFFSELGAGLREGEWLGEKAVRGGGRLGSKAVSPAARALRGAGRFVGRHAGPIGLGLEALFLANTLYGGLVREPRKAEAVERTPAATPASVLRDLQQQELLARRQARLARQDPEAYQMLTELLGGGMPQPRLARGEFVVGGQAPAPVGSDEIQNLLAMMQ